MDTLFRVREVSDLFVDGCIRDPADGSLLFLSTCGRDGAMLHLFAAFALSRESGGLDGFTLVDANGGEHRVPVPKPGRLVKVTGKLPANLFGSLAQAWLFDRALMNADRANRSAWCMFLTWDGFAENAPLPSDIRAQVWHDDHISRRVNPLRRCMGYRLRAVRRVLLIVLLVIVPVQLLWAAAAPYCAHESSVAAKKHVGHHEHEHQAGIASEPTAASDDDAATGMNHVDCQGCHLGASVMVPVPEVTLDVRASESVCEALPVRYVSFIPPGPERPDRFEPSAAARSAGGVEFVRCYPTT